jgi:hypothetical protein
MAKLVSCKNHGWEACPDCIEWIADNGHVVNIAIESELTQMRIAKAEAKRMRKALIRNYLENADKIIS